MEEIQMLFMTPIIYQHGGWKSDEFQPKNIYLSLVSICKQIENTDESKD